MSLEVTPASFSHVPVVNINVGYESEFLLPSLTIDSEMPLKNIATWFEVERTI